ALDGGTLEGGGRDTDIGQSLRGLERWLADITRALARCSQETPQRIADAITRLNERLDRLIVSGRTAATEFERRVAAVALAVDDFAGEARDIAPSRPQPHDDLVSEIRTRQRDLDQPRAR